MDKLDILNRELFVDQLMRLVENISTGEASVSFAIDGTWGCGKSFVLDMFEKELSQVQSEETSTDKYLIIRYNCWKYDYYEEPIIAIVATIIDTIAEKTQLFSNEQYKKITGILKAVGTTLLTIANSTLKNSIGIDISEAFSVVKSGIDAGEEEYKEMQKYDVFFSFNQTLHSLQKVLNEISEQYVLVFLVDEIDRCLPEYAIKVLERLHHITESTNNIINIVAIDKAQLQASIDHIFGFKKTDEYLKKFIQFSIPLNIGKVSEKIVDKYNGYISLFDSTLLSSDDSIEEFLQILFVSIDIRGQEQLIQKAMLVHRVLYSDAKDYSFMCVELLIVTIKFYYQNIKLFSKWFDQFATFIEASRREPPFSHFFENKFNKVPHHEGYDYETRSIHSYYFERSDSLYCAIAYTWYKMHLKNVQKRLDIPDGPIKKMLMDNVWELKKFIRMLELLN